MTEELREALRRLTAGVNRPPVILLDERGIDELAEAIARELDGAAGR